MLNASVPILGAAVAVVLLRSLPRPRQAAGIALGFDARDHPRPRLGHLAAPRRFDVIGQRCHTDQVQPAAAVASAMARHTFWGV